uniref:Uncharacterized protein n=1 Tax=Glossina austeni TaxID=7395 RepID=A0A1A9VBU2_GLOAU
MTSHIYQQTLEILSYSALKFGKVDVMKISQIYWSTYWGESLRNYQLLVDGDDEFVRHADASPMLHVEQYTQYVPLFCDGGDDGISCHLSERRTSQSTYTLTCNKVMGMEPIATLRPQPIQSYLYGTKR